MKIFFIISKWLIVSIVVAFYLFSNIKPNQTSSLQTPGTEFKISEIEQQLYSTGTVNNPVNVPLPFYTNLPRGNTVLGSAGSETWKVKVEIQNSYSRLFSFYYHIRIMHESVFPRLHLSIRVLRI